jgi:CheY-like chemotaxis protein
MMEQTAHVLVAEDEALAALGMQLMLTRWGYRVTLAKDGLHAIECEEQDPPVDLLVTDLRMPRLDGRGLIRQLRIKYADLPVVVTSGYVSPEIAYELETQINRRIRVLCKPFDPADLRASVGALLAGRPREM